MNNIKGKRVGLVLLLIAFVLTMAACEPAVDPETDPTMHGVTVEVEGQGRVIVFDEDGEEILIEEGESKTIEAEEDSLVTLEADPSEGWGFEEWTGDVEEEQSKETEISIIMDDDKEVRAIFSELDREELFTGKVTQSRGGTPISGAKVTAKRADNEVAETVTDTSGEFVFYQNELKKDKAYDLLAEKEGYAASKFYDVYPKDDFEVEAGIIMREIFDEREQAVAPELKFSGIEREEVLTESLTTDDVEITIESSYPIEQIELRYSHQNWLGDHLRLYPYEKKWTIEDWREAEGEIFMDIEDPGIPAGEGFIEISLYDIQYNRAVKLIPVKIVKESEEDKELAQVPLENIKIEAWTFSRDLEILSQEIKEESSLPEDLDTDKVEYKEMEFKENIKEELAEKESSIFTFMRWDYPDENLQPPASYYVYRGWNEKGPWQHIATIAHGVWEEEDGFFRDLSAELEPGLETYYRIAPVDGKGEAGPKSEPIMVKPLERFEVFLSAPEHEAEQVSLTPELVWEASEVGKEHYFTGYLLGTRDDHDSSWDFEKRAEADETFSVDYGDPEFTKEGGEVDKDQLQPAREYRWDINYAEARKEFSDNSIAISVLGTGRGGGGSSINGEFIFVTEDDK